MRRMPTSKGVALIDAMADLVSVDGTKVTFGGDVEIDGQSIADNELNLGTTESSSGTLTASQLSFLQNNPDAYITMAGEKYYLAMNSTSGYMNYACVDYANGAPLIKVITITVSTLAWVLSSQNVGKKTYCHPIAISWGAVGDTEFGRITCLIFSTSATPFTISTFKAHIDSLRESAGETIQIMCSGGFVTNAGGSTDGNLTIARAFYEVNQGGLQLDGVSVASARSNVVISWGTITTNLVSFTDGVNAIN